MPSMFFDEGVEREDGRKYNPQVMSFIRDDWILRRMQQRCVRLPNHATPRQYPPARQADAAHACAGICVTP